MSIAKEDKLVRGGDLTTVASSLKTYIQSQVSSKFGSVYFDSNTNSLLFFKNDTDRSSWIEDNTQSSLVVSSIVLNTTSNLIYRVALTTGNSVSGQYNTIQVSANASSLNLIMNFDIQVSTLGSETWSSTGQSARFKLYTIDSNNNRTEIPIGNSIYFAGQQFVFNIMPFLNIGTTRVEVVASSESNDTITSSFTYQIVVSEMYIEPVNSNWYNAIVENGLYDANYKLGGFKIIGSMSKTLHIDLYQANTLVKSFEKVLGQSSYNDESPYYFTHLEGFDMQSNNSNLTTGIYMVRAYLTSDTLTSLPVIYNIMYVSALDINTAELVCINNVADLVYNYSSLTLCQYAIYNKGASVGTPHLLLKFITGNTPSEKENRDLENTTTGELHNFNYNVEWLTEDTANLFINLTLSLGQSSQILNIPIDNSATYPAETGAVFYLNSTTRNNTDTNRTKIVNEATLPSTELTPTWTKMSWVDGIDGWTVDNTGRKCLLIPAKSLVSLPYQLLTGENITIELCYKVANVADYDENVITIASNPTTAGFQGIRIKPTNITVHSSADSDASKDTERGTNLEDEVIHHLIVTIANSYSGNSGKNLVTGYVDGSVAFQFEYANGTVWSNNVPLIIGSQYSDVYIYFIRAYNSLLGKSGIEKNYINSLNGLAAREAVYNQFYSIVKQSTREITYENISKSNKNFFVVEMLNDSTIPSRANSWSKDTKGKSNFEMHFGEHPLWDFKLYNVETAGQGTTSMDYYRWNLRFRIDKSNDSKQIDVAYYNSPTVALDGTKTYSEQTASAQKAVYFGGGANNTTQLHPKVKRITAKINFASSMQSHKIGATKAYNDLRNQLGLSNEAQDYALSQDPVLPKPTVAVYQYPAFGFSKNVSPQGVVSYEYIGLFTIGPDKGDKPTFGYDISDSIKESLITLEGTDHSRRLAKFLYPWNSSVEYRASNECLNVVMGNGELDNAWEVSNCFDLSTDKATDQPSIQTYLETEFKPAYDVVYNNSTQIFPIALNTYGATASATLAYINANVTDFRLTQYDSRFTYADMEFWIEGEYILYYYDIAQDKYVSGVNLITDLNQGNPVGSTLNEKNEWFKQKRRDRFKANVENYWDIQDAIYHFLFILWFGATDNFAKNTYPYKMGTLASGARWKWRQDDLDTIFDIDNTGGQTKPYYIEYLDSRNGSPYFAGSASVFWNLLFETYWEDYGLNKGIASNGKDFITAMTELGTGSNAFTGCRNFINSYFWNNAQNYFNQSAYNIDAVYKYETAWIANGQEVDPLKQSLGNHYSAEQLWVDRRIIYMMSLFKVGPFGGYGDASLGRIAFRPKTISSFNITPIMELYPAIVNGAGSPIGTTRTQAGTVKEFTGVGAGDGNTTFYIQGTDYLTSLGDWKNIELGTGSGGLQSVSIEGKKLKAFNIGDATASNVTTNIPGLGFPNNKCLETINARNASSLNGPIELSNCTRLISADFRGTNVTQVTLPTGSKIEHLHLSDNTKAIILKNLNFLQDLTLPSDLSGINTIQVENCTYQGALDMLRSLYNSNNSALQYIRVIWSNSVNGSVEDMQMLANIKQNKDKSGNTLLNPYGGIANDGNTTITPVIEGTLNLTSGLYTDDLEIIGTVGEPEVVDGTVVKARTEAFGTLYIIYDSARIYINFADSAVRTICINNFSSDSTGVTLNDAANTPMNETFRNLFRGNTSIETFDEYKYFTSHVNGPSSYYGAFQNCTNLTTITLPDTATSLSTGNGSTGCFQGDTNLISVKGNCRLTSIGRNCFTDCSSLEEVPTLAYVTSIGEGAFARTTSFEVDLNLPSLTNIDLNAFGSSGIKRILSLGNITTFNGNNEAYAQFRNCTKLKSVVLPSSLLSFNNGSLFYGCTALEWVDFSNAHCSISPSSFRDCTSLADIRNCSNITIVSSRAFAGCSSLAINLNLPSLTGLGTMAFMGSAITSVVSLGSLVSMTSTSDNEGEFQNCTSLTSVVLPNTLTTLGQSAFRNCTNLETINFPNSLTTIRPFAFQGDSKLTMELPQSNNITTIGHDAFVGTKISGRLSLPNLTGTLGYQSFKQTNITSVVSLGSVQTVGSSGDQGGAFYNCTSLTSVTLPNTLTEIQQSAFRNCTNLETVSIPSSLINIRRYAFYGCPDLVTEIPQNNNIIIIEEGAFRETKITGTLNLTKLGSLATYAFKNTNITSITSLGNLTSLPNGDDQGNSVFSNCKSLASVTLSSNITTIGKAVFYGCSAIESINLNYVTTIGQSAFNGAFSSEANASIPTTNSITTIEAYAFNNSNITGNLNLTELTAMGLGAFYKSKIQTITSLGSLTSIAGSGTDWQRPFSQCTSLTSVVLPNTLVSIGEGAFNGCTSLSQINFPSSLTTIGVYAFCGCTVLQEISQNNNITTIGQYAFRNSGIGGALNLPNLTGTIKPYTFQNTKITSITSLGSITSIVGENNVDRGVFYNCIYLTSVTLPSTLTNLGLGAFQGCIALQTVTCLATTPPTWSNPFGNCPSLIHVYVPAASVNTYKAASGWSSLASKIEAIPSA